MIESGQIEKKILERTANATACLGKPGSEEQRRIVVFGIQDLGGIFLVLIAGIFYFRKIPYVNFLCFI